MPMKRAEAVEIIAGAKGDAISVATMRAVADWYRTDGAKERHIDCVGCMGGAAPLGLGLAMAQPDRHVIVIDGDGSLLMQLGVLASIAGAHPVNLHHVVLVNRVYETSGNQPIPGGEGLDFVGLALSAGYRRAESFSDAGVLAERLATIFSQPGPSLIAIEVDPEETGVSGSQIARPADPAAYLRSQLVG
jgi:sulfopyruvate decarboxylase subunit beta